MKKFITCFLVVLLSFIFINSVFATTEEEELKKILDLIPNEYNLDVISSLEMTELQAKYYLFSNVSKILDETEYDFSICPSTNCGSSSPYMVFIDIDNGNYKLTLSKYYNDENGKYGYNTSIDDSYSVSKQIIFNLNYVEGTTEDKKIIDEAITYISSKTEQFSDFDFSYMNYEFITSPQIINESKQIYNIDFINYAYAGSTLLSNDEQLEVSFHKDCIYVLKNGILYKIVEDNIIIDTTFNIDGNYFNYYYPKLILENYDDIEKCIDDVLIAFKERTGYTNCMIKETDDGIRYEITSTSDESDSYMVTVINLDDNTEWNIFFSGKLKEKEETSEELLGDMNKDGKITITDVIILLRKYLGLE